MRARKKPETKEQEQGLAEFVIPDHLGTSWQTYRSTQRFRLRMLEEPCLVGGLEAKAGDYVGVGPDGGLMLLTNEELAEHYELDL